MVKDEASGTCYRSDHLLKDYCKDKLQRDITITSEMAVELKEVLSKLDVLSAEELGEYITRYGITAPDTQGILSRILIHSTSCFKHQLVLLVKISPRQGLLRVREFTLAEIEHFVEPEDKSHPKFSDVAHLEFLMFPREEQKPGHSARIISLGEAVSSKDSKIVDNETLGYFIGIVYLFLTCLSIDKNHLRFRQHIANEMAHYAQDCWDAEIETSYG
ncbi:putative glycine--tRNA ligase [Rosa chinensis]|uniref:Putative glycine--tRNA ligase n=1 Tax=Rosa chinensis TaxID=74649 RepID=A0A2P6PQE7_ROSCH|nr:putative glycine--tRNA ligase [Rosa chinensis]